MADRHSRKDQIEKPSRSRSPTRDEHKSHRTRSPHRHHHRHKTSGTKAPAATALPYNSRQLTKGDFKVFRPMFGLYLDIQKQKDLDGMDEVEAKGRWKSFLGKWYVSFTLYYMFCDICTEHQTNISGIVES